MKVVSNLSDIRDALDKDQKIGLTIGNFDGVHQGHQSLLKTLKKKCDDKDLKVAVMTFHPHPRHILAPTKERFLICDFDEKRLALKELGVDFLIEVPFTRDFSTLGPDQFLEEFILKHDIVRVVHLGYDFAFGANKAGDHEYLTEACKDRPIEISKEEKFIHNKNLISSTFIRSLITEGKVEEASQSLGREYYLTGLVVKGQGRGKQIGFPTANIQVSPNRILPAFGVYITKTVYDGMTYHSVTNIGKNPTFNNADHIHIETNLFDFEHDIYGEKIQVFFMRKIRDEQKFNSVNELIEQIGKDVNTSKEYFKK